jgi:hypothetical protein
VVKPSIVLVKHVDAAVLANIVKEGCHLILQKSASLTTLCGR